MYNCVKILHILSGAILYGSSVFFLISLFWSPAPASGARSQAFQPPRPLESGLRWNWMLVAPAFIVQLLSGFFLVSLKKLPFSSPWVFMPFLGYFLALWSWFLLLYWQVQARDAAPLDLGAAGASVPDLWRRCQWQLRCWASLEVFFLALTLYFMANLRHHLPV